MSWIQTYTGKKFDLLRPRAEDVDLVDIAHSLSNLCRFNGHTGLEDEPKQFYSVAEHSVNCVKLLTKGRGKNPPSREVFQCAFLHDAAEAYIGDIATPFKLLILAPLNHIELSIEEAIQEYFHIPDISIEGWALVKQVDRKMLDIERKALMKPPPERWEIDRISVPSFPGTVEIHKWLPKTAEAMFLNMARNLCLYGMAKTIS